MLNRSLSLLSLCLVLVSARAGAQELQRIGHLPFAPLSLAGCWHHVDSSGGEWGLIGTSAGLSIVDLRDPTQPKERFAVPGVTNGWRELRSWAGHVYVGSEGEASGITIVDLRELPDTIYWKVWRGDVAYDSLVTRSHTLQTEAGLLYIFGGQKITNGAVIADLADPWNPVIIGQYTDNYVHDGYIRNDTLWSCEITKGWAGVVDIKDKSQPKLLTTIPTPGGTTHNAALNLAGNLLFTAGENPYAALAVFDVSDLENPTLLDTYFPSKKPQGEVHNVRFHHDFLVNPSYRGQLTIVDASRPANLIETAWDSLGTTLVWDADPYLPSGIILATARSEGLYVYKKPAYTHACWLEGSVRDALTGHPLSKTKVFVLGTLNADTSRSDGAYRTGAAVPGSYEILATKTGYEPATISGIQLLTNQVTALDILLYPLSNAVSDVDPKPFAQVSPAPFEDYFEVKFHATSPYAQAGTVLRLYTPEGKFLLEKVVDGQIVTLQGLGDWPVGTYLLQATPKTGAAQSMRLIKAGH